MADNNTPILVGIGQFAERLDAPDYRGLSPVEVAVEAARAAFGDALSLEKIGPQVDLIATTRTFEDSAPHLAFPFGKSNNYPRSICKHLGIDPAHAIWEAAGGNTPQHLVNEIAEKIAAGEVKVALLAGAEAISTARHLQAEGKKVDWSETVDGQVEDRFGNAGGMLSSHARKHGLMAAPPLYGFCENARRRNLKLSRADYALEMGRLFAPFTRIASTNPYSSMANRAYSAEELATVTEKNRLIADPYPRLLVSRDQVNQGAALILTSVGTARELGIPEANWLYLHGYADASERDLLERPDHAVAPSARAAAQAALDAAGVRADDISFFDLYSCFPIAVSNVADYLGVKSDDPRGLTATGGLPYFGGPGNNYSMHGIASVAEKLRAKPGSFGFVGANGGFLSKYSVGIYSTTPAAFKVCDSGPLQAKLDAAPIPPLTETPEGEATVETYTIIYGKGGAATGIVIGRLKADGVRFIAATQKGDEQTLQQLVEQDPLGATVFVRSTEAGNRFAFDQAHLDQVAAP
jgi:acetyl-CoA C-acetyltransferase